MKKLIPLLMMLCVAITLIAPFDVAAAALKLNKSKAVMEVDSTLTLKLGSLSGNKSSWSTSNKKVASISNTGMITAKAEGAATITATYQKKKYTCKVTVVDSNKESNSAKQSSKKTSVSFSSDISDIKAYKSKQYKVGTDLPAGEYILFINTNGIAGHFTVSSDRDGTEELFRQSFETNAFVTVKKGEYLKLSRCTAYEVSKFYKSYTVDLKCAGIMLKGGEDLKPGEYKIVATGSTEGYYCIYDTSRYDEIVVEENFKKECYVSVGNGQYLILKGCKIQTD